MFDIGLFNFNAWDYIEGVSQVVVFILIFYYVVHIGYRIMLQQWGSPSHVEDHEHYHEEDEDSDDDFWENGSIVQRLEAAAEIVESAWLAELLLEAAEMLEDE